ncbi:MAG TPA: hypothetical protein VG013_18555 [Gemmataceae bacterium]|jgi:hypothetical protein|nr:hypothetical protein [Gemmataceae bacterium]
MTPDATLRTEEQPRSRIDLAGRLLARVGRLEARLGEVSLAAEVQLLKRELARGHELLSSRPADNDYLAAVTLVEAALASLTWKGYTPQVLDALRQAFAAGTRQGPFTFADYDAIRRQFAAAGIPTAPAIDLPSPAADAEDEDGPHA